MALHFDLILSGGFVSSNFDDNDGRNKAAAFLKAAAF
jgi:hypothetical protein